MTSSKRVEAVRRTSFPTTRSTRIGRLFAGSCWTRPVADAITRACNLRRNASGMMAFVSWVWVHHRRTVESLEKMRLAGSRVGNPWIWAIRPGKGPTRTALFLD